MPEFERESILQERWDRYKRLHESTVTRQKIELELRGKEYPVGRGKGGFASQDADKDIAGLEVDLDHDIDYSPQHSEDDEGVGLVGDEETEDDIDADIDIDIAPLDLFNTCILPADWVQQQYKSKGAALSELLKTAYLLIPSFYLLGTDGKQHGDRNVPAYLPWKLSIPEQEYPVDDEKAGDAKDAGLLRLKLKGTLPSSSSNRRGLSDEDNTFTLTLAEVRANKCILGKTSTPSLNEEAYSAWLDWLNARGMDTPTTQECRATQRYVSAAINGMDGVLRDLIGIRMDLPSEPLARARETRRRETELISKERSRLLASGMKPEDVDETRFQRRAQDDLTFLRSERKNAEAEYRRSLGSMDQHHTTRGMRPMDQLNLMRTEFYRGHVVKDDDPLVVPEQYVVEADAEGPPREVLPMHLTALKRDAWEWDIEIPWE
eukprot:gnl/Dysnectes_brevis/4749_a6538_714.p1 GENE.gnl/Dysnectes_brevis/4749_a6538_714~~gnl/Dysnectes_brevis/4749_a6538_714.p1  ORF type:complete len:434 (-),score=111.06 gnl/Dysnectes_brevis/4749_a6538_714:33-1334(-)